MGLRETKAQRTRNRALDVALELFLSEGYAATTMEAIAERAEIGATTLYRYFASKDVLLLERLMEKLDFSAYLRARPRDEPVGPAIAGALLDLAEALDDPRFKIRELRRVVDGEPVPRARLWDLYLSSRTGLEHEVAARLDRPASDLGVRMTSSVMLDVITMVDEEHRRTDYARSSVDLMTELLQHLPAAQIVLPRLGD